MAFLCGICIIFSLTACAGQERNDLEKIPSQTQTLQEERTQPSSEIVEEGDSGNSTAEEVDGASLEESVQSAEADVSESNILIAYFTWADNTEVENADAAIESALSHYESVGDRGNYDGVDAVSSASVIVPGNTAQMALRIQERTGGELFSIVVTEPYPSDYDACIDRAADEKAEDARPELAGHVEHMEQYDTVFLGFPNWWSSAPMAVFSFLEEYDFSGKTVIPFCAHGTGGIAGGVRDITAALPDSVEILEPVGVYRADMDSVQSAVDEWLDGLGY